MMPSSELHVSPTNASQSELAVGQTEVFIATDEMKLLHRGSVHFELSIPFNASSPYLNPVTQTEYVGK